VSKIKRFTVLDNLNFELKNNELFFCVLWHHPHIKLIFSPAEKQLYFTETTMNFLKLLSFALFALCSSTASAATVEIGRILIQLRSRVGTDNSALLSDMLSKTTGYLDDYFGAYYSNTDYFSHTVLATNSLGVHGVLGSYITTLEFEGLLFFNSDPAPSGGFVNKLLTNAFQGLNQQMYLTTLSRSGNVFLEELTYIIIEINDETVTQYNLEEGQYADLEEEENSEEDDGFAWNNIDWFDMSIYIAAGLGGTIVFVCLFCLCRCYFSKDMRQIEEERTIDTPSQASHSKSSSSAPRVNHIKKEALRKSRSSGSSQRRSESHSGNRSPSPARSIVSQDSSKFTYNPGMSKASMSIGSLSHIEIGLPSMDLDAWQRQNTISPITPAPFGHDISAIEQSVLDKDVSKDLSLIEEEDEESYPDKFSRQKSRSSLGVRKSRRSQAMEDISNRAQSQPTITGIRKFGRTGGGNFLSDGSSASEIDMSESSEDVINDLKDLSAQFDLLRRSSHRSRAMEDISNRVHSQPVIRKFDRNGGQYLPNRVQSQPTGIRKFGRNGGDNFLSDGSSASEIDMSESSEDVINDLQNLSAQFGQLRRSRVQL
jgi:hypothetical protein